MVGSVVLNSGVMAFIRQSLRSSSALEALLMLRQQAPRPFSVLDLVRALRASPTLVDRCLDQLRDAGVVARDEEGNAWYAPGSTGLAELCDGLAAANRDHPVAVRATINPDPDILRPPNLGYFGGSPTQSGRTI